MRVIFRKVLILFFYLLIIPILLFCIGALYYSGISPIWFRYALLAVYSIFSIEILYKLPRLKRVLKELIIWGLLTITVIGYWSTIQPTNDRVWRADMARLAQAYISNDKIRIVNIRHFDYVSLNQFTPKYEERIVELSHLQSVDFFISYWMPGPVAHTFVSFNFDNAPPIAISIEARYGLNESYDPIASLFKQFTIIYIVGDEQDIVRLRTNFRKERVYRYPLQLSPLFVRRFFLIYMERINELAKRPEFYNLIKSNCTINIVRYANRSGRIGTWDIRMLLNGYSDRYLYDESYINNNIPFNQLREKAYINDLAMEAGDSAEFSRKIRERLPNY